MMGSEVRWKPSRCVLAASVRRKLGVSETCLTSGGLGSTSVAASLVLCTCDEARLSGLRPSERRRVVDELAKLDGAHEDLRASRL